VDYDLSAPDTIHDFARVRIIEQATSSDVDGAGDVSGDDVEDTEDYGDDDADADADFDTKQAARNLGSRKHLAGTQVRQKHVVHVTGMQPKITGDRFAELLRGHE
jgi:hypothetical protein